MNTKLEKIFNDEINKIGARLSDMRKAQHLTKEEKQIKKNLEIAFNELKYIEMLAK